MNTTHLRRTVPFLVDNGDANSAPKAMIDQAILTTPNSPDPKLVGKLISHLDLSTIGALFPEEICAKLILEQYEVCLEHIYSHSIWSAFRQGESQNDVLAYLLETRHYLHAAASRMAPGVAASWRDGELARLLAKHVLEEADHARFFDESLEAFGCAPAVLPLLRPSPITLEWIYLMRSLSARDPLIAAVCSGLMEMSAADHSTVLEWHRMLLQHNLLPKAAIDAILQHVNTDIELGHGNNWEHALRLEAPLTAEKLRDCLNSVSAISEIIYRWLTHLRYGLSATAVRLATTLEVASARRQPEIDPIFDGTPVWPAEVMHTVSYGSTLSEGSRSVVSLAYYIGDRLEIGDSIVGQESALFCQRLASPVKSIESLEDLRSLLGTWLRIIDGHRLWSAMIDAPCRALIYGWVLENYFYFFSACRHISAALASCPDPLIRDHLLIHLREEADHADLLRASLCSMPGPVSIDLCRPLPTTLAFIGYLREIASLDWRAYCLALVYIQLSLSPKDSRRDSFFESIVTHAPELNPLLHGLRVHDEIDADLGHSASAGNLLSLVFGRHLIDLSTIKRAAVLTSLSWSFLDGIRCHYLKGDISIFQRLGWSARNVA